MTNRTLDLFTPTGVGPLAAFERATMSQMRRLPAARQGAIGLSATRSRSALAKP